MITFNTEQVTKNTTSRDLEALSADCPDVKLQEKSVEYTQNAEYEVVPDTGYDGLSKVNVSVDLVVPTVQDSKTVEITSNGETIIKPDSDYDVVEQVVVNTNIPLQEKQVDVLLSETETVITPDNGYEGISKITVNHSPVESNTAYEAVSNGSYTITPTEGFDATTSVNLTVNVPEAKLQDEKSIIVTENGDTNIEPDETYDAIKKVVVTTNIDLQTPYNNGYSAGKQDQATEDQNKLTTKDITANGSYTADYGYSSVNVNVPTTPVEPTRQVEITSNGTTNIIPADGYDAIEGVDVTVNVTEPPTVYDISNKYVSLAGGTIDQNTINTLVGWDTIVLGAYKLSYATWTGGRYVFPDDAFKALRFGTYMFASPNGSAVCKIPAEFPELQYGDHMFYDSLDFYSSNPISFPKLQYGDYMFSASLASDYLRKNVLASDFPELTTGNDMFNINPNEEGSYNFPKLTKANNFITGGKVLTLTFGAETVTASQLVTGGSSLTKLIIHNPNTTFNSSLATIFPGFITCKNEIDFNIDKIDFSVRLSDAQFTQDSVNNIINALQDATASPKTITFAATPYSYITDEQKEAATAKGWTINQA